MQKRFGVMCHPQLLRDPSTVIRLIPDTFETSRQAGAGMLMSLAKRRRGEQTSKVSGRIFLGSN